MHVERGCLKSEHQMSHRELPARRLVSLTETVRSLGQLYCDLTPSVFHTSALKPYRRRISVLPSCNSSLRGVQAKSDATAVGRLEPRGSILSARLRCGCLPRFKAQLLERSLYHEPASRKPEASAALWAGVGQGWHSCTS